jgi:fructosamine-3-kinase
MVERFFAEITRKRIRRGVFKNVDELKQAIMDYLDNHNGQPQALHPDQDCHRNLQ